MIKTLSLLAGLAAALVAAPARAADNPWRSGGDFYGNGEAAPAPKAPPKAGSGFGRPSRESLYPPLNEDEVGAPPPPPPPAQKGRQAPLYPPLDTAEPRARTAQPPMQGQPPPGYRPPPPGGHGPGYGHGYGGYGYGYGYPGYGGYYGGMDPALGGWPGTGLGLPGASPWLGAPGLW